MKKKETLRQANNIRVVYKVMARIRRMDGSESVWFIKTTHSYEEAEKVIEEEIRWGTTIPEEYLEAWIAKRWVR